MPSSSPRFLTTCWTMVLAAGEDAPGRREALSALCSAYWYPLYAFVRRKGYEAALAEDLTQEFFSRLLEKNFLASVAPERGRFRTFLLVCLERFLANERDRARALKRGGGRTPLSIDFSGAEDRYAREPAHEATPERIFERRWALVLLEQVLAALEEEMLAAGKQEWFEALRAYLTADADAAPYADVAARLGMSEGAVKVAVHRLRRRYRDLLREAVAGTVAGDPAEVDAEIRDLFESLGEL